MRIIKKMVIVLAAVMMVYASACGSKPVVSSSLPTVSAHPGVERMCVTDVVSLD